MKIRRDIRQRTEAWEHARRGIPTASQFHRIITPEAKKSAQAADYMQVLLTEWFTGKQVVEWSGNHATERGEALEAQARSAFEFAMGVEVEKVGLVTTDEGMVACSPDGIVKGANEPVELKCPYPHTHMGYLINRKVESKYKPQVQGQIWLCEAETGYVQSFCPGMPTEIMPCYRSDSYIDKLRDNIQAFLEVMLAARHALVKRFGEPAAPKEIAAPPDGFDVTDEDIDRIIEHTFPRVYR